MKNKVNFAKISLAAIIFSIALSGCTSYPVSGIKKPQGTPVLRAFVNSTALASPSRAQVGNSIATVKIADVFMSTSATSNSSCIFKCNGIIRSNPMFDNRIQQGTIPVSFIGKNKKSGDDVYYLLGRTFINPIYNMVDNEYLPFNSSGDFLGYISNNEGGVVGSDCYVIPKTCRVAFKKSTSFERINSIWEVDFMGYYDSSIKLGVYTINPNIGTKDFVFAKYIPLKKGASFINIPAVGRGLYAFINVDIIGFGDGFIEYKVLPSSIIQ